MICSRCKQIIDDPRREIIKNGEHFHSRHFHCYLCNLVLTVDFKEVEGRFYCANDYKKIHLSICYVCRKPIEGRSITALNKSFHPHVSFNVKIDLSISHVTSAKNRWLWGHSLNTIHILIAN